MATASNFASSRIFVFPASIASYSVFSVAPPEYKLRKATAYFVASSCPDFFISLFTFVMVLIPFMADAIVPILMSSPPLPIAALTPLRPMLNSKSPPLAFPPVKLERFSRLNLKSSPIANPTACPAKPPIVFEKFFVSLNTLPTNPSALRSIIPPVKVPTAPVSAPFNELVTPDVKLSVEKLRPPSLL